VTIRVDLRLCSGTSHKRDCQRAPCHRRAAAASFRRDSPDSEPLCVDCCLRCRCSTSGHDHRSSHRASRPQ
jgi:hypothetical protein